MNNSVRLNGDDRKARVALAQYIARAPLSLEKLVYDPESGKIFYHSTYNPYLGENVKAWDALEFIALATQFVPPQGVRLIRYFGLYSSRSRWKWPQWEHVATHAPRGWKQDHGEGKGDAEREKPIASVPESACRSAWAKLISRVYDVDPLVCARCGNPMKVLAVITDPSEVSKILKHLLKIGRPPPGLDPAAFN